MNYVVIWPEAIRRQLLGFYAKTVQGQGRETAALNAALTAIEGLLQRTPSIVGESRSAGRRVSIISPVSVVFSVLESERRVIVHEIHYSRGKRT